MFLKKNMFILLWFCIGNLLAQTTPPAHWIRKDISEYTCAQYFPDSILYSEKQIFTDKGAQTIPEFTSRDKQKKALYSLAIRTLSNKKEIKSALKEETQRFVLQYGVYPKQQTIKDTTGNTATTLEIQTDKQKIVVWIRTQGLNMYIQRVENEISLFSEPEAMLFFNALYFTKNENTGAIKPTVANKPDLNWIKTEREDLSIQFPQQADYKIYFIKNDSGKDYNVENYRAEDHTTGIIYQLTKRYYDLQITPSQQWLSEQVLVLINEKKMTLVSSKSNIARGNVLIADYEFTQKKQVYKIRYIISGNMLYQLSASGNKKSIHHKNNAYFFESFVWKQ